MNRLRRSPRINKSSDAVWAGAAAAGDAIGGAVCVVAAGAVCAGAACELEAGFTAHTPLTCGAQSGTLLI